MQVKIRTLIVDDSVTVRKHIREVLSADPSFEVVGEAADGQKAIELCETLRPDVITLDIILPEMNGLEVTEHIMAYRPTPILIVSSSLNRGEVFRTYDALKAGAVDVLDKPKGGDVDSRWPSRLISTLKIVSKIRVITHPKAKFSPARKLREVISPSSKDPVRCVAIGVSTGGPNALSSIFKNLPADFPLPILLVIHIGRPFDVSLAEWLNGQSEIPVATAVDGEPLPPVGSSKIIMAPPDFHLVLEGGLLKLKDSPERYSCRPSVDVLFESISRELGSQAVAMLLTGMGRDGASGLLSVRRSGGITIAQDEETSVVFGMPKEAIQLGAAQYILPLEKIAPTLTELAGPFNSLNKSYGKRTHSGR